MKRDPLDKALRELPVPEPPEAEARGLAMVEAAHAERRSAQRPVLPRLALAFSLVTVMAALLLSPAGAAVTDWVGEVVDTSTPRPEPGLAGIPGGGRLLVQSPDGPWVVQPDGSRRLLGDYREATWSPRGLFVAAVDGRTLSALELDGTPRWSITAREEVGEPRWAPFRYRIVYRSGSSLRVIAADGTGDRLLTDSTAYVAPSWSPTGEHALAHVSGASILRLLDSDEGSELAAAPALPRITWMEWGAGGTAILEASPETIRLRKVQSPKLAGRPGFAGTRLLPVPKGSTLLDVAIAPQRAAVAAVLTRIANGREFSSVLLFDGRRKPQRLLSVPGELGEVAWSPDGRRLLVAWPDANQWLFLPAGRGKGRALADVSAAFSPGQGSASFPRIAGWCCRR